MPVTILEELSEARSRLRSRGYGVRVLERTNGLFGLASPGEVIDLCPFAARPGRTITLIVAPQVAEERTNCHSSYTPCVPIASDADCAGGSGDGLVIVNITVQVIGPDVYDLDRDRDRDGDGCD